MLNGRGLIDDLWNVIINQLDTIYVLKLLSIIPKSEDSKKLSTTLKQELYGNGLLLTSDRELFSQN